MKYLLTITFIFYFSFSLSARNKQLENADYRVNKTIAVCGFAIDSENELFRSWGGSGTINLTTTPDCDWTAQSDALWIKIISTKSGAGAATIQFTLDANHGQARAGSITVGNIIFTVLQESGLSCTFVAIDYGQTIEDNYSASQCTIYGNYSNIYTFNGNVGDRISIYSSFPEADINLYSDLSGFAAPSAVSAETYFYTLPTTGSYTLYTSPAVRFDQPGSTGSYTLSLTRIALASPPFDFDGDGKSDPAIYRPESATWFLLNSNAGFSAAKFGLSADKPIADDYDGDGKTDYAVFRENLSNPEKAHFYILQSLDNTVRAEQFGAAGDIPVGRDWDGDFKADLAVYREGTQASPQGYFYFRPSSVPAADFIPVPWGNLGDMPLTADFDGDGKTDAAVFRPSSGVWYIQKSREGYFALQFGLSEDKPVASDFDGDGRADQAVFRPSSGVWYIWGSSDGFSAAQFGVSTDKPVPGDYDGDGKTDITVYRDGTWFSLGSTRGFTALNFGNSTDKPVAHALVP